MPKSLNHHPRQVNYPVWRDPGGGPVQAGDIWQTDDGATVFRVVAANEELVEVQWWAGGRFSKQDLVAARHLMIYVAERNMSVRDA